MVEQKGRNTVWLVVLLGVSGGILLAVLFGMLVLRYREVEQHLDRMLSESLTAHTVEIGDRAGGLIQNAQATLENANRFLAQSDRRPEKSWVTPALSMFSLGSEPYTYAYLDLSELTGSFWDGETAELVRRVRAGETVVSNIIVPDGQAEPCLDVVQPVSWEGQVVGVLQARMPADALLHQGQQSTFFHSVHSVIAGEDGSIAYGQAPGAAGLEITDLGIQDGLTQTESQVFATAYQENVSGFFFYDPAGGRCYVAWAPVSCNGWRVVQFSQSPNVQIDRNSMIQTVVMLASLMVCALLAVTIWRQRAKLNEERLRYDALAQFKDTLLFEYNCEDDSMEFTSNAMETLDLESPRMEDITKEESSCPIFHPDDLKKVRQCLRDAQNLVQDQIEHDRIRIKNRGGGYSWYRSQYKPIVLPNGRVDRIIGTLTDISLQMDREQELYKQAQQDPLTGLYNRAGVMLINARLEQISRGLLFMLDLDDFKSVNDTYGHAAGDKLLIAIGHVLKDAFRTDDIVARVGGDEFVALLSGSDNESMACLKAQELLDRVKNLKVEGIDREASVSIGISRAPACGRSYESLSAAADKALYQVKKDGKGGFALCWSESPTRKNG